MSGDQGPRPAIAVALPRPDGSSSCPEVSIFLWSGEQSGSSGAIAPSRPSQHSRMDGPILLATKPRSATEADYAAAAPTRSERFLNGRGVYCVPVGVGLALALITGPQLVDDSFISMRYAANIAAGNGPVFNVGAHVEGFSNPLWTVLLSIASALGLSLPRVAIALGVLAFLATIPISMRLARQVGARPLAVLIAGMLVATCTVVVGSSLNGLETALFGLGMTAAVLTVTAPTIQPWLLAGALLVVAFSRPEGPALAALILGIGVIARRASGVASPGAGRVAVGVGGAIAVGFTARVVYYGQWLPMSAIAKRDRDIDPIASFTRGAHGGISYLTQSLGGIWIVLALVVAVVLLIRWRPTAAGNASARVTAIVATFVVLAGVAGVLVNRGDWMPHGRLIAPYLPVAIVLLTVGIDALAPRAIVVVPLLILAIGLQPWGLLLGDRWQPIHDGYDTVAPALATATRSNDEITTNVLGHLGYSALSLRLFDLHGLTEPSIAQLPRQADSFGKEGADIAGRRNNVAIVVSRWPLIGQVTEASEQHYVALVSPELTAANLFIAVRDDAAARYAKALQPHFDPKITDLHSARNTWASAAPQGQVADGGP